MNRAIQDKVNIFSEEAEEYLLTGEFIEMDDEIIHLVVPRNEILNYGDKVILVLTSEMYGVTRYHCTVYKERIDEFLANQPDLIGLDFGINSQEETIQRRRDVKVKVTVDVDGMILHPINRNRMIKMFKGTIRDISASGILIATDEEMEVNQVFSFFFPPIGEDQKLTAQVVRMQEEPDGLKGYGCRLIEMHKNQESSLRQYVFKIQLKQRNR